MRIIITIILIVLDIQLIVNEQKEFKEKSIAELTKKEKELKSNIDAINKQLGNIDALSKKIEKETEELIKTNKYYKENTEELFQKIKASIIREKYEEIEELQRNLDELNAYDMGAYPTEFEFEKSETYKEKLKNIKLNQEKILTREKSKSDDTVEIKYKNLQKLVYFAFNIFCDYNLSKLTFKNYPTRINQIESNFIKLIKLSERKVLIPDEYRELKLKEIESSYGYYKKIEEEKEILREQREQERENARAQKELEEKQAKIDKEIEALNIAKDKIEDKIKLAKDEEIESLKAELEHLRDEIANFENEKSDIDYRIKNTGAGYVYIISNIGSFGNQIYKIGVTRRLDPYERIAELSSASVPFKFDVHAMVFSYQAYQLETELHRYFDKYRVNKVNNRKEFFNIELDEIKKVLDLHKELTFDYEPNFKAEEFRESVKINGDDPNNIDDYSLKFVKSNSNSTSERVVDKNRKGQDIWKEN